MQASRLPDSVDVAIVGGGLAGLSCASALSARGLSVAVLERDGMLGGRARSWLDDRTGDPVHIGPHIFLSEYPNLLSWLEELGTADKILWLEQPFIHLVEGARCHAVRSSRLPPPLHFVPSMLTDPALTRRDLLSNARVSWRALRLTEEDIIAFDAVNALGFLRSMGVTQRLIDRFWSFVAMSILNVPIELCSAGALMRFYRELMTHRDTRVGLATVGLGDLFAPGAVAQIQKNRGTVRTGVEVVRIAGNGERATGVELGRGRPLRARHVVAAVPAHALRRILRTEWRGREVFSDLVHFEPCPYVSTYLWFDRKLTDRRFWARVHEPNDLNCDFYDLSNLAGGWPRDKSLITSNVIWSHRTRDLTDSEIITNTIREIAEFLPEASKARVVHAVVNRIPMAVHCAFPGTERRRPSPKSPIENLVIAGDWVRTGVPACMEGATRSGFMAAEIILAAEGRPERLVREMAGPEGLARWLRHVPSLRRVAA